MIKLEISFPASNSTPSSLISVLLRDLWTTWSNTRWKRNFRDSFTRVMTEISSKYTFVVVELNEKTRVFIIYILGFLFINIYKCQSFVFHIQEGRYTSHALLVSLYKARTIVILRLKKHKINIHFLIWKFLHPIPGKSTSQNYYQIHCIIFEKSL